MYEWPNIKQLTKIIGVSEKTEESCFELIVLSHELSFSLSSHFYGRGARGTLALEGVA
jgi:hypothetical protein